jgi:putative DNA primase/helicase
MSQGIAYQAALLFLTGSLPGSINPETVRWRGHFYQRVSHCYQPVSDEAVQTELTRWLARNVSARTDARGNAQPLSSTFIRDAMLALQTETAIDDSVSPGSWITPPPAGAVGPYLAMPEGVLDLGRLQGGNPAVLPGSRDFFTLTALPVVPAPTPDCPCWSSFLCATFPGGEPVVQLLQELFGYCLWPDCRYEQFFVLQGPANSGKSTVAETLQALFGGASVAALPLERFGERFALAGLVGKMANIVFDASEIDRVAEGTLKTLVSGEPVTVEQKHCPVDSLRLTAKHVFVTNVLPRFHDTSDGLWRRLALIPFERVCPPEARDPELKARLRAELPGIAAWALQGLARLRQQGRFSTFERAQGLLAEYRQESNPVALFLAAECAADPDGRVGRQALYARYRDWAAANGHAALSSTKFYRKVRALYPQPEEEVRDGHGGDRMFIGLRLAENPDVVQQFRVLTETQAEGA